MSGTTPLQTGGSNSVNIGKENLPNVKLKVDSFSLTTQPHTHKVYGYRDYNADGLGSDPTGKPVNIAKKIDTDSGGGQNTGTASPSTENLGSGTSLNIQPVYITLKFWKRTS